ncbi:MAG: dienelactone hydrolase family protein [Caldilineaceae bacterium]
MYETDHHEGMIAETVTIADANGDVCVPGAPAGTGAVPGMVLAHHMPGWDSGTVRRRASSPTTAPRFRPTSTTVSATTPRGWRPGACPGGVPDDQAVGDLAGAMRFLRGQPTSNGKVGIFGTCSGGRHAYLAACRVRASTLVLDLWGSRVVATPDQLTESRRSPIDYAGSLLSILGLFGEEDQSPTPEQVAIHEAALKEHGKEYEFHMYPDAGHGFFYYNRPNYRQAQAVDGWEKIWAFLARTIG